MHKIILGDCLDVLKTQAGDSVDLVVTDPPYGYSFMGKDWDKSVPSVDVWKECLRVLKPGAFAFIMSAPRSDVQCEMITRIRAAGFRVDFTPIYWTYATGFPKAANIGKMVDKRLGAEREVIGTKTHKGSNGGEAYGKYATGEQPIKGHPTTPQAKDLDGSYGGFQPKPAVEVIIVAMKPISEKTFVDQALKNGKGVTWLNNCRVPISDNVDFTREHRSQVGTCGYTVSLNISGHNQLSYNKSGRFPANLLVSDDVLNEHSRYFDLDKWASTLPFLVCTKANKREKNEGLDDFEKKMPDNAIDRASQRDGKEGSSGRGSRSGPRANHHPTVKPLKLMSYLITLGSRPGDTILDPFTGSGTTMLAAQHMKRNGIGIELSPEYAKIARARLAATQETVTDLFSDVERAVSFEHDLLGAMD